jgi:hypothetical protein
MGILQYLKEATTGGLNELKQTSGGILQYLNKGFNNLDQRKQQFYQPTPEVRPRDVIREATELVMPQPENKTQALQEMAFNAIPMARTEQVGKNVGKVIAKEAKPLVGNLFKTVGKKVEPLLEEARKYKSAEDLIKKIFYKVENIPSDRKLVGKNQIWFITSDGTPISVRKKGGGISGGHDGTMQDLNLNSIEVAKGGLARARVSVIPEKSIVIETKIGLNNKQMETIEKFYPDYKVYYEKTKIGEPFNGTPVESQVISKGKNIKSQLTDIWDKGIQKIK